jgi:peptidoglycan glycosyltransferase
MSSAIVRLFGAIILLFAVLTVSTTWWTVVKADELRAKPENRRALLQEERIKRGIIRTADGKVVAGSRPLPGQRFTRRYPLGDLFGHPVGYAYTRIGRSGLERQYNDPLTGRENELLTVWDSILGHERVGKEVRLTVSAKAQQAARDALGNRVGAVVALKVDTGAVQAMWSYPGYDPNGLDDPKTFTQLANDNTRRPLVNRATQDRFPPGSTMKPVTAAAALDTGRYKPDSRVSGKNGKKISGVPLNNFGNEDFGDIDLTTALTNSVNTVWAEVGEKLGRATMADYMARFGFYEDPPLDYPDEQMIPSGVQSGASRLLPVTSGRVDVGRVAIGQGGLEATPMQMAMVAQTIGNHGVRMKPFLVAKILDTDGRTVDETQPAEAAKVMSAGAADQLTAMMRNVVKEGTGTAAALQGVQVAGKTGTAEVDIRRRINDTWFIGFTDRFAVAVVVDRVPGGTGGTVAAPIAKKVLEALGE